MKKIFYVFIFLACLPLYINAQWTQLTSPSTSTLNCLYFNDVNTGYITGYTNGIVIKTINGGTSWSFYSTGTTSTFYDIFFNVFATTGFVTGTSKQVLRTTNSGVNWDIRTSGSGTINSFSFPLGGVGYAVGSSPTSLGKSTDNGNTWLVLIPPTTNTLRGVFFVDPNTGWVCGYSGTLFKTTDGCNSWIPETQLLSYNLEKLYFPNPFYGFTVGSAGLILKTTNAGTNWNPVSSGVTANLYDVFFIDQANGWAVGSSGKIIRTTDIGNTWYPQNTPNTTSTFYGIQMLGPNNGYVVGSSGILLKTTNGGGPPIVPCFTKITNDPVANISNFGEGCAWGDYDNDGYQDLVVTNYNDYCQTCTYPFYLFHNNGNGSFTRVTTGPIANYTGRAFGASWGDYDNDGKLDLYVCTGWYQNNLLFHNEGSGNFTQVTAGVIVNDPGWTTACSWFDYDRDGWLDLFAVNQNNNYNFLYHNNGNGTFTKITNSVLVNTQNWARGVAVGDFDNNGWPDVYINSYQGQPDQLFRNLNGIFYGANDAILDHSWGSGAVFGDYDNDGFLDLFVTNHNSPNALYHNSGNGTTFTRVTSGPGADTGPLSFGCVWLDYNNDGKLDLYVSNFGSNAFLYMNLGNGNFSRVTSEIITNDLMYGIGNSSADINMDGKVDLFSCNNGSGTSHPNLLYLNTCQNSGNYIGIKLKGCMPQPGYSNKSGIGARINVYAGGVKYIRDVTGGQGYHSESSLWQNVGIGNANTIDSIVINWPSSKIQKFTGISANQYILADECLVGIQTNGNEIPKSYYLSQNYPNPFNPNTKIKYQLPATTQVTLEIFDNLGKKILTLVNTLQHAGYYEVDFDGENFGSGIYFYKIMAGNYVETRKMLLIK